MINWKADYQAKVVKYYFADEVTIPSSKEIYHIDVNVGEKHLTKLILLL